MRKIGLQEIEDIATGAALLGAGGGGDPYIGKLMAIGAIKEHGPVTLLDPDEVPDDALIVPIAMMGAPTVLCEKGIGGNEYQVLYDMVSKFYGKSIYAFMPSRPAGSTPCCPSPPPRVWVCPWWTVTAWDGPSRSSRWLPSPSAASKPPLWR